MTVRPVGYRRLGREQCWADVAVSGGRLDDGAVVVTTRRVQVAPERAIRHRDMLVGPDRRMLGELVARLAAGRLVSRVAAVLPLSDAAEAHRRTEAGGLRGKIVLRP